MKNKILLSTLFMFVFTNLAHADIVKKYKYLDLDTLKIITLKDSDISKCQNDSTQKILLCITDFPSDTLRQGWTFIKDPIIKGDTVLFDLTKELKHKFGNKTTLNTKIRRKNIPFDFKVSWSNPDQNKKVLNKNTFPSRDIILQTLKRNRSFLKPYDIKNDKIDLFFNESGRLLNTLPVNVDQSDIFYLHVLSRKEDKERYWINIREGLYAPVDLSIRPFDKISSTAAQSTREEQDQIIEYEFITLPAGPFTSDNFSFQIAYDSINGRTCNGPTYTIKINKLYHVGIGVSVVNTWLENPDFRIAPLGNGTNTIESYNNGPRTFLTVNVMWYWSVLQQKAKGSVITNGRDILKDEPTWSFNRIFPTVGVSLDGKLSENFFAGLVYEFARGGSIIAGMHYGRVQELSDKAFILNKTIFAGTNEDIRINNVYKPAFFIGVNVDTRIFNALFSRNQ